MEINGNHPLTLSSPPPPGGYNLKSIMTHEAGHFRASPIRRNVHATMYQSYIPGTAGRSVPFRRMTSLRFARLIPTGSPVSEARRDARHGFFQLQLCRPRPTNG